MHSYKKSVYIHIDPFNLHYYLQAYSVEFFLIKMLKIMGRFYFMLERSKNSVIICIFNMKYCYNFWCC